MNRSGWHTHKPFIKLQEAITWNKYLVISIAAGKLEVYNLVGLLLATKYKSPQTKDAIVMYVRVYQYSEDLVRTLLFENMSRIESSIDGKLENMRAKEAKATSADLISSLFAAEFKWLKLYPVNIGKVATNKQINMMWRL